MSVRLAGIFQFYRSSLGVEGTRLVDQAEASMLPMEAMGSKWIPRVSQARGYQGSCMEHSEVGPWSMAVKP